MIGQVPIGWKVACSRPYMDVKKKRWAPYLDEIRSPLSKEIYHASWIGARNEGLSKGVNLFSYFEFCITYKNGCIHDSKSIGAFHKAVLIHNTRLRARAWHCSSTNRMKYHRGNSSNIIVDVCVSHHREGAKGGDNIVCPCGGRSKSLNGLDRFS